MKRLLIVILMLGAASLSGASSSARAGSSQWSEPVPVDEVNTGSQEDRPVLSFDGLTLYFGRRVSNVMRIYEARRETPSGPFGSVREILSSRYHVFPGWVSPDNLRMYYHNELPSAWLLKVSERASVEDSWPLGEDISELNSLGNIHVHGLTGDELTIVFGSPDIPGGFGGWDLWMASRSDRASAFGNVRNLAEINTAVDDVTPFITSDGLAVYFASDRAGDRQIFRAGRGSRSEPFGDVEPVAIPGASVSHSPALSSDGSALYFGSNGDIYVSYLRVDGPVAHWRFDEGSGLIAYDSAGDNDGVVYGAQWTTGQIGGALDFDGSNDYVDCGNFSEFDGASAFSISFWVRADSLPFPAGLSGHRGILRRGSLESGDGGLRGLRVPWIFGPAQWSSVVMHFDTVTGGSCDGVAITPDLTQGKWHHVVMTWDGTTVVPYRDAVAGIADTTIGHALAASDTNLEIGRIPSPYVSWDGQIDDVRIYTRALSLEEIRELYGGVPLAAVYHIDGVAGNDLNDGLSRETAFKTIQKGIEASDNGDEVVVWPGLYQEAINFKGKAIAVKSAAEPAVIEATGMDAVTFHSAEGPGSVLKNFIIRNSGMAVSTNYGSSPTISNLTIVNNDYGIGAYEDSDPNISNCIIWDNKYGDLFGCEARYSWVQQELEPDLEDPNGGLVSHWALDEGAGLIAYDSAGSKDGVVFGAKWASGQLGAALDFDGADDYVALPDNNPVWLPQNSFALSAWVYFDRAPAASGGETFLDLNFADSGTPSNELGYVVSRAGAGYAGRVAFGMTTLTNTDEDLHSNEVLSGGRWYHVVAVRDGTTQAIYIDGQLDNSRTCSPDPIDFVGGYDDDKVNIGRVTSAGVGQYYVDGKIDDVRIYDRALSASEVLQLYEPVAGIDPLFADPAGGDYHLLSGRGRYWPAHDVWVLDRKTSPCIDAGDPAVDPSGEPMPNGGRINIGAYGGTIQASMSEWPIASDYNRDGRTNFEDFAIFCEEWLATFPWADGQPEPEPDLTPPTPSPATWDVAPYSTSSTVSMAATVASDESGVEYYFENVTVGGRASGWQASNNWTDTGLVPSTQYCYRVKTRDKSPNMNESAWSSALCARTSSGGR